MHKSFFVFIVFIFSNAIFSQEKNEVHQQKAKQAVLDFFEGFHQGDTTKIGKTIDANLTMLTVVKDKKGVIRTRNTDASKFLEVIHNRPKEQKWLEKLLDFKIDANAQIAQVWTPYEFYVNDQFSHCGVNVFQLFNDGENWRIMAIADTRNREGCK
ncbi:nuclear transport factor 2 family protein [Aquimarina litoralis]|uniref:nuclear transport factor 2 family protein n=1 Tax=Aquimarina litoralis TaxID=584605 RepID=UPI001C5A3BF8|nr:nuclear transport factor 2 family protein [Aquimarina litoralis]MBW1298641.1 nuclear transport factor 2 family protein [Aquimarina litoralis]